MTEQVPAGEPPRRPRRDAARRTLDEVFGEVLPDTTSDEREPREQATGTDSWYLENRPPHHGDR
ncbi:hypothetical protein [Amycolatopsis cihanbeyliensis]|uniref:Uncharacterized protein n=1 Tax=Amycolatopsis cihanbeyliensis TaxID=1128664 RepID=A0A542DI47_AMYCI|nr:hypothetical protein [Amycolatopsis cihanbeyliensis]TQJ02730.1 hypothetical protein FB471_2472 [Amycolatopsis cihanbeyliensis]